MLQKLSLFFSFPVYHVINFETNLSFHYQVVFLHDQKRRDKKINILRTKKAFKVKILKKKFIIFKGLSFVRNCLSPEGGPLMMKKTIFERNHGREKKAKQFQDQLYECQYIE